MIMEPWFTNNEVMLVGETDVQSQQQPTPSCLFFFLLLTLFVLSPPNCNTTRSLKYCDILISEREYTILWPSVILDGQSRGIRPRNTMSFRGRFRLVHLPPQTRASARIFSLRHFIVLSRRTHAFKYIDTYIFATSGLAITLLNCNVK